MFEYSKIACDAVKILDQYDFKHSIDQCRYLGYRNVYEVKDYIEEVNGYEDEVLEALDNLSTDEFMEYLTTRYGVYWKEIISYRMW